MVTDLESCVKRAVRSLRALANPDFANIDKIIPTTLIRNSEGIAFITFLKGGAAILGAKAGVGCVIAKVRDPNEKKGWRWSAPASVVCGGLAGGFIWGGERIDAIIILNTRSAVRAFMGESQVTFGGNVSLAVGPIGREITVHAGISNNKELIAAYSYSHAKGAYIGGTLEGSVLLSREAENKKFYEDHTVSAEQILSGFVQPPFKAMALSAELNAITNREGVYADNAGYFIKSYSTEKHQSKAAGGQFWQTVYTSKGNKYYYNTETKSSQWEVPKVQSNMEASQKLIPYAEICEEKNSSNFAPGSDQNEKRWTFIEKCEDCTDKLNRTAIALYDFIASHPDELSFKADARLEILEEVEPFWWRARLAGKVGLIPANYIEYC